MGDAYSHMIHDQRREGSFGAYIDAILAFVENPSEDSRANVLEAARKTDEVPPGFWGARSGLSEGIQERLDRLANRDEHEWGVLLASIQYPNRYHYLRLKELSPFKDKLLLVADYGLGFVHIRGDVEQFVADLLSEQKNWKTYDCDDYLVIMDKPEADAIWLQSGRHSGRQEGPRPNRP